MLLAAAGLDVTVYEAQPVVGGRTACVREGPYRFDLGPTFFMMPYVLEEIFASTGRRLGSMVELTRLDPMYQLRIGQPGQDPTVINATQDLAAMEAQLARLHPQDGPAFQRFIADNRRKLARMKPILQRAFRSPVDYLKPDMLMAGTVLKPWQSLYQHLEGYFKHPATRLAMSFQSKYLGMSPFECPELFSILPFIEYEYGIWHPTGGCNAIMDAMATACKEMGVRIHTSAPVQAITFSGTRATGVVVDGQEATFQHVVVNADATWALKNLVPAALRPRSLSDAAIDQRKYSCSTAMLYLGVEGAVDLPHHTIYTSRRYVQNLEEISTTGTLSEDPSMYVCNPSRTDATLAPPGHSALYVLVPTPNNKPGFCKVDWATAPLRERALQQLEAQFGLTDIRSRIRAERMITPADWQAMRINHGATFNLAHTLGQMLHFRPQHRLQGFDNLWLVGGGTHPGSGLPVIFLSSGITARLLCDEAGVRCPLDDAPPERPMQPTPAWATA